MELTLENMTEVLGDCRRVTPVLSRLGDKWTVLVIVVLRGGPRRFNDIKRNIDGISQQMLARTLKSLVRDGMLIRTTFATSPPQVQYELSELGTSLSVPVLALGNWVHDNLAEIELAQARFDLVGSV
jgi:DNA-binding HxlR family transcriptional regulator